jgi:hypothetical protein
MDTHAQVSKAFKQSHTNKKDSFTQSHTIKDSKEFVVIIEKERKRKKLTRRNQAFTARCRA